MKYCLILLLLIVTSGCGEEYETRFSLMKKVGPLFNDVGQAIDDENLEAAKASFALIDQYIQSKPYLDWRTSMELDSQAPYQEMEKKLFNIGASLDSGFAAMRVTYSNARINCLKCHYKLSGNKRSVMNQQVRPLKKK